MRCRSPGHRVRRGRFPGHRPAGTPRKAGTGSTPVCATWRNLATGMLKLWGIDLGADCGPGRVLSAEAAGGFAVTSHNPTGSPPRPRTSSSTGPADAVLLDRDIRSRTAPHSPPAPASYATAPSPAGPSTRACPGSRDLSRRSRRRRECGTPPPKRAPATLPSAADSFMLGFARVAGSHHPAHRRRQGAAPLLHRDRPTGPWPPRPLPDGRSRESYRAEYCGLRVLSLTLCLRHRHVNA